MMNIRIAIITIISIVVCNVLLAATNESVSVGEFSVMDLTGWKEKSFNGNTKYQIIDKQDEVYLQASADMSASAYYKKIKVDLTKTPYLNWSWRIDKSLTELNEQTKQGDDYAARIYVIVKLGLAPWKTKALNYVWSSSDGERSWPNAYTDKAIMVPMRSRNDNNGQWQMERVNVKKDFMRYFGIEIDKIDGVAIMTDTDDSKLSAVARYGDIFFTEN